jgi:hypothetical protein
MLCHGVVKKEIAGVDIFTIWLRINSICSILFWPYFGNQGFTSNIAVFIEAEDLW